MALEKENKIYQDVLSLIDKKKFTDAIKIMEKEEFYKKRFFYNRINELSISKNIKNNFLEVGKYALSTDDYETAYDYFSAGKYLSDNPLFDYYLGECCFHTGNYTFATEYFDNYTLDGSLKLNNAYAYLYIISKMRGYEISKVYLSRCRKLDEFLDTNYALQAEEFFKEQVELSTNLFNTEIDKIKELLLTNRKKEADKMLINIKPITKEQKEVVKQLIKNKKLYLNKLK